MTLQEFYDLLDSADWYYNFSDDGSVYRAGLQRIEYLNHLANQSTEFRNLFDSFEKYHFSGVAWDSPKAPKPVRPI